MQPTNERKQTKQMKKLSRGHRLQKATIDASSPIHVTAIRKPELVEIQKSDGAYQIAR